MSSSICKMLDKCSEGHREYEVYFCPYKSCLFLLIHSEEDFPIEY